MRSTGVLHSVTFTAAFTLTVAVSMEAVKRCLGPQSVYAPIHVATSLGTSAAVISSRTSGSSSFSVEALTTSVVSALQPRITSLVASALSA